MRKKTDKRRNKNLEDLKIEMLADDLLVYETLSFKKPA
jgi:hypothetical protein